MPLDHAYRPLELPPAPAGVQPCAVLAGERPRDFQARIRRRDMRSIRRALRAPSMLRQRLAGIATFGALGMVLGPIGWAQPGGIEPATAQEQVTGHERVAGLQPFERGGDSFPGSAFYWMAQDDSGLVSPAEAQSAWDDGRTEAQGAGGGVARPIMATGTTDDRWRALQCLTAAIYYEAASESDAGQRAVAQVVLNRVTHPAYPNTVCGVVYQGSERPGCQFSFACDGSLARKPMRAFWDRARRVAADALAGYVYAPIGLATHYHTTAVHPYWAPSLDFIGTIGAHRFYRWAGAAGRPAAFTARYAGGEPVAAPHPRTWTPSPTDVADPLALEKAFEEGRIATTGVVATPASMTPLAMPPQLPPKPAQSLVRPQVLPGARQDAAQPPASGSGSVLPGYESASRWIAQPGS